MATKSNVSAFRCAARGRNHRHHPMSLLDPRTFGPSDLLHDYTLCLSSQVGCKMGCTFCETGRMGLLRQLTVAEIVAQVVTVRAKLGWAVKNLVFMGMGEALDNADNVIQALRVLTDKRGLHYSPGRLTIHTAGPPERT